MSFSRFQAWLKPCLGSLEQGTGQQCLWTLCRARIQRLNRTPLFTNRTPSDTRRIRDPERSFGPSEPQLTSSGQSCTRDPAPAKQWQRNVTGWSPTPRSSPPGGVVHAQVGQILLKCDVFKRLFVRTAAKSRGSALWLGLGLVLVTSLAALATLVAATLVASPPPSRPRLASISPPSRPRLSPASAISPPPPSASRPQFLSVCVSSPSRLHLASPGKYNRKGTEIWSGALEVLRFCGESCCSSSTTAHCLH